MNPGEPRVDLTAIPTPIRQMLSEATAALRGAWTLCERTLEVIRLYSANENQCRT
jgi:hypothetical protein